MIGFFGDERADGVLAALKRSFEARGHVCRWRNVQAWTEDQFEPQFDIVVVLGMRGPSGEVARRYMAEGRLALVLELGYIKRAPGRYHGSTDHYYQLGVNGLNWVPPFACEPSRLRKLEVAFGKRGLVDGPIVVCGQVSNDASHGLGGSEAVAAWAQSAAAAMRPHARRPILWRPHPREPDMVVPGLPPAHGTLEEVLSRAWAIVTYSSNTGHEAIIAGVPVFAWPRAPYYPIVNHDLARIEDPVIPDDAVLCDYFQRLAYAQWTIPELASGVAANFIWKAINHERARLRRHSEREGGRASASA